MTVVSLAVSAAWAATPTTLVPLGTSWRFLDTGVDPGPTWADPAFDDSGWPSGIAPLGYGAFVTTTVPYGASTTDRHPVTWLRTDFVVPDASVHDALSLDVERDDGVIVYLNGVEVGRHNVIGAASYAAVDVTGFLEGEVLKLPLSNQLVDGTNVLAIALFQATPQSDDLFLDAALIGWSGTPSVVRGPYLQMVSSTAATIRWRTDAPSTSQVEYGPAPGALGSAVDQGGSRLDHELRIDDLLPGTDVTYAVGTRTVRLVGDDLLHTFRTPETPGTRAPFRLWAIGDAGTASLNQEAVRDGYEVFAGDADSWIMLGDNAYNSGLDAEYQRAVFDIYDAQLPNTPVWATLGNHDGYSASSLYEFGPYYDIFSFPRLGENGGVASGTEAWYSFDWGNVHFVCLDSYGSSRLPGSPMLQWLASDSAATSADWTIAYWHHPPYSRGSHNSDYERELVDMRQYVVPLLEGYGVDLVLNGHSHSYERTWLIDGHHGLSTTFGLSQVRAGGDGNPAGGGAYTKPSVGPGPGEGAVFTVAGSSGQVSGGLLDHPAMFVSLSELGSLVIDVDGLTLDSVFIDETGAVQDSFRIEKGVTSILELYPLTTPYEAIPLALTAYGKDPTGAEVVSYAWSFGDGTVGQGADVTHTWPDDGVFPVVVTVVDLAGDTATRTLDLVIQNAVPIIDSLVAGPALEGDPTLFTATAHDPGNDPVSFRWDFGDGSGPALGPAVQHVFLDSGPRHVVLTVDDGDGGVTTGALDIVVIDQPPDLQGIDLSPPVEGEIVVLTAGVSEAVSWSWDFHDGRPPSVGQAVEHTWDDDGVYAVTLRMLDDEGGSSSMTVDVVVANVPPRLLALSAPSAGFEGEPLPFFALAEDVPADPLTVTWGWGDFSPDGDGPATTHAFADDGQVLVVLTVDDGDGGLITDTVALDLRNLPPTFGELFVPISGDEGQTISLHALALDPGANDGVDVVWSYDGVDWLGEDVSLVLGPSDGDRPIVVTADDGDGGSTTEVLTIQVRNLPPVLEADPLTTVAEGSVYVWQARASDPGADPLVFHLDGPASAAVDDQGVVRWFPEDWSAEMTLRVSDGAAETEVWWRVDVLGDTGVSSGPACGCGSPAGEAPWLLLMFVRRRQPSTGGTGSGGLGQASGAGPTPDGGC